MLEEVYKLDLLEKNGAFKKHQLGTVICCEKCGSVSKPLRVIKSKDKKQYFCEDCIRRAIINREDIRKTI